MADRVRASRSTPAPSRKARTEFISRFVPADRRLVGAYWHLDGKRTIGEVLDAKTGVRCLVRFLYYSPDRGLIGTYTRTCRLKSCPECVVSWLADRAAGAWAFWDGGPVRLVSADAKNWRTREGVVGAPGILAVTVKDKGRWAFIPDPEGKWSGDRLDDLLLRGLRGMSAVPEDPGGRKRNANPHTLMLGRVGFDQVRAAAESAGIKLFGDDRQAIGDGSEEAWQLLKTVLGR